MSLRNTLLLLFVLFFTVEACPLMGQTSGKSTETASIPNPWKGKRVAYLGDSITDQIHVGTKKNYWNYLEELLGITPFVYGINGHQWTGVLEQAKKLKAEQGNQIDAILIFAGTNDYNAAVPLGEWYTTAKETVEVSGPQNVRRMRRSLQMGPQTFCGRINEVMDYLKTNFPTQQIILLTPIHRGYARFGDNNIQPDESYPNELGLYVDQYVEVIKQAANVWAVPVIDLNSISGLYPVNEAHGRYFHRVDTDRLHPNDAGHYRMAKALMYQLLCYPAGFE